MSTAARPAGTGHSAAAAVGDAYTRIEAADRPEIWITLRDPAPALAEAETIDRRVRAGETLPLAGLTLAVKDNIDVAGLPTTAACRPFAYHPDEDAPVVAGLRRAGAVVLGKTNLDQFATGLAGTRSPYGAVRDARDRRRVAGGSSSGSAVAVALGLADIGLGTDTAGSGRVPAAFQGVFGVKPTAGLLSTVGVVPACRSFDCVSLFVSELEVAAAALSALAPAQPWPDGAPVAAPAPARVAIPAPDGLAALSAAARDAFAAAVGRLEEAGAEPFEFDLGPCLEAGALLYGGAFVAERYAAVGRFIAGHLNAVDPAVAAIILGAEAISAEDYLADWERLRDLRARVASQLVSCDALLLPTAPFQPTREAVIEEPIGIVRELGSYTSFTNLLGFCALALPAGETDGGQFGVTLMAPGFHDAVVFDLALQLGAAAEPRPAAAGAVTRLVAGGGALRPPVAPLLVVGAHLSGQPLNGQLTDRGGVLIGPVRTAPEYRLYRLDTDPPKPGLVRCGPGDRGGAAVEGELWALPPAGLAGLLTALPRPMAVGPVALADGSQVPGFLCEPAALDGAAEITARGGWRAYLAASA